MDTRLLLGSPRSNLSTRNSLAPPQEDLSNVRVPLAKGAPGRANINWEQWKNVPDSQSFNLPNNPDEVRMLPTGTWRGQILWSKWQRKKAEYGGGLSLRLQVGFHAIVQGQTFPYKVWTSIGQNNADTLSEFAMATCPNKQVGQDDFGPNDALGRHCMISIGYGTGNWGQNGKEPRIVIQRWAPDTQAANGGAPAPQAPPQPQYPTQPQQAQYPPQQAQYPPQQHQQPAPQQAQYPPQQQYQQPAPPPQQYQQAPQPGYGGQPGYGQTYGGGQAQGVGAPAPQGHAPDPTDLPF
jgi:hypothetical protein